MVENWQIFGRSRSRNSKPSFGSRYIRNCVSSETVLCIDVEWLSLNCVHRYHV